MSSTRPMSCATPGGRSPILGPSRGDRRRGVLRLVALLALVGAGNLVSRPAPALTLFVDPVTGVDAPEAGRDEAAPLQSLTFALLEAARVRAEDVTLRLGPGRYAGRSQVPSGGEVFPLSLPPELRRLEVAGPEAGGGRAVLEVDDPQVVWIVAGEAADAPAAVTLRGVEVDGGYAALSMVARGGVPAVVTIERCAFRQQSGNALDLIVDRAGSLEVTVADSRFSGVGGGVLVEALEDASCEVTVAGSVFEAIAGIGPAGDLGAGVALHIESGASLVSMTDRCVFRGTASALCLTSSGLPGSEDETPGDLYAAISNSLVHYSGNASSCAGPESPETRVVRNALYLSARPPHSLRVVLVNNTFYGIESHVVLEDNHDVLRDDLGVRVASLEVHNNIFWSPEAGTPPGWRFSQAATFPPPEATVESNIVPAGWHVSGPEGGAHDNWSESPRFVDPESCDFRLSGDSPAIDRGNSLVPLDLLGEDNFAVDLAGQCRRSTWIGPGPDGFYPIDLGAYESSGYCEAAGFRSFIRGDCDFGGEVDLSDAIYLFSYLFLGGPNPPCSDACDADDNGILELTDGITTLGYLFVGTEPPRIPFPDPGLDPTPGDPLGDCLEGDP